MADTGAYSYGLAYGEQSLKGTCSYCMRMGFVKYSDGRYSGGLYTDCILVRAASARRIRAVSEFYASI